jgi:hypothetical protein
MQITQVFELPDDTVHRMSTLTNNSNAIDTFHPTDHMPAMKTAGNRLLQHLDKRPFDVTSFSDITAQSSNLFPHSLMQTKPHFI